MHILFIPLSYVLLDLLYICSFSLLGKFQIAPAGPHMGARCQIDLYVCIGKDRCADIPSIHDHICGSCQSSLKGKKLLFGTKSGMLKIVDGSEFETNKRTVAATKLAAEGDEVLIAAPVDGSEQIVLQSREGYFLRFGVAEIPEKKKGAVGVRGMRLSEGDSLEGIYLYHAGTEQTIEYKGKQLVLNKLKPGSRDTKGVKVRGQV